MKNGSPPLQRTEEARMAGLPRKRRTGETQSRSHKGSLHNTRQSSVSSGDPECQGGRSGRHGMNFGRFRASPITATIHHSDSTELQPSPPLPPHHTRLCVASCLYLSEFQSLLKSSVRTAWQATGRMSFLFRLRSHLLNCFLWTKVYIHRKKSINPFTGQKVFHGHQ